MLRSLALHYLRSSHTQTNRRTHGQTPLKTTPASHSVDGTQQNNNRIITAIYIFLCRHKNRKLPQLLDGTGESSCLSEKLLSTLVIIVTQTRFCSFFDEKKLCLHCRRCVYLTHCSDARGRPGCLRRCSVLASPLSVKYILAVTAFAARRFHVSRRRGVDLKIRRAVIFDCRSDFRKNVRTQIETIMHNALKFQVVQVQHLSRRDKSILTTS